METLVRTEALPAEPLRLEATRAPRRRRHDPADYFYLFSGLLTLTSAKVGREGEVKYPATFHIGFIQESEEKVNEINRRLKEDGFDVPPPDRQHGSWTFYFRAPGGFLIEVLA